MVVLSLFDGIGCGRLALKRAKLPIDCYLASEINESSIQIAKKNFPEIIEIGNVCNITYAKGILTTDNGRYRVGKIDLLIGGSPCTNFSSLGYKNGVVYKDKEIDNLDKYLRLKRKGTQLDGQSYLFWEYVRLLREIRPTYFLLENVVMENKWEEIITNTLGVSPIKINSALLSAQNRQRLYWTDIQGIKEPKDKGIKITDILCTDADKTDVSESSIVQKNLDNLHNKYGYIPTMFNAYNSTIVRDKACALSRGSMVSSSCATLIFVRDRNGVHLVENHLLDGLYNTKLRNGRYNLRKLSIKEMERLQTLPDDYTDVVGVSDQKRRESLGNAWTIDVIAHLFRPLKKFIKIL